MVFGGGLGTGERQQKDTQGWDGKTYPCLGPSQGLRAEAQVQTGRRRLNSCFQSAESSPCAAASPSIFLHIVLCSDA